MAWLSSWGDSTGIWIRRADGSAPAQRVFAGIRNLRSLAWHPDGVRLVVQMAGPNDSDLHMIRPGVDSVPTLLLQTRFSEGEPAFSPDGHWLAFVGNDTGRDEVYVRPFPDLYASLTQISSQGGYRPAWSGTGREVRFVRGFRGSPSPVTADLVSVGINPGTPPGVGKEQVLFSESRGIDYWGATPDGQRFAIVRGSQKESRYSGLQVVIVENWFEELKAAAGR